MPFRERVTVYCENHVSMCNVRVPQPNVKTQDFFIIVYKQIIWLNYSACTEFAYTTRTLLAVLIDFHIFPVSFHANVDKKK
jgi:hypothetical protein